MSAEAAALVIICQVVLAMRAASVVQPGMRNSKRAGVRSKLGSRHRPAGRCSALLGRRLRRSIRRPPTPSVAGQYHLVQCGRSCQRQLFAPHHALISAPARRNLYFQLHLNSGELGSRGGIWGRVLTTLQAVAFGAALAWMPCLIILAVSLWNVRELDENE